MLKKFCRVKIHHAKVTDKNLEYSGSITLDEDILETAGILAGEMLLILNIENGARFETYAIKGKRGSGEVCVNGAAARFVEINDRLLILSTALLNEDEVMKELPAVIYLDDDNRIIVPEKDKKK